ncbi:probable envelope ADP,ATP carrier protein, chloroplastic isoform X2 [Abrus precatorius]|uniref:Probable envelope ADP,ATP carrier protein, chloroplastic isoform X2 n=1 Tax=Abrus precatorius TaxID=3816 RepID=A0A8B8JYZ1_ABRPR|nr:probable envelope ADP,ATP carrier protein, chloroplastic isoform X2 [Abrus precatorius]
MFQIVNMTETEEKAIVTWRNIPNLKSSFNDVVPFCHRKPLPNDAVPIFTTDSGLRCKFASVSVAERKSGKEFTPTATQLLKHPLAVVAFVPKDVALFLAGAIAGAAAKTVTAPLDRIKLLMQTHGVRVGQESVQKSIGLIEAITVIGKEEGIKGYWKGNLPQVIRVIPYSAVQLFAYEIYKVYSLLLTKIFKGKNGELSVVGRLAAGAFAGMTSTFITYPLDVLRLRLAVEPGYRTMSEIALSMLREEGFASFYYGLGPSLIGIAPYIKSLPEKYQKRTETSLITAVLSASLATLTCYPLDTVRRQMQLKGTPYKTVLDAITGIVARDGIIGLYRGFVPNALKNLPNSSIRLTTYDIVKRLIAASEKELETITEENRNKQKKNQ